MACRNAYRANMKNPTPQKASDKIAKVAVAKKVNRLLFGVHSATASDDLLQNNLDLFEWVERNKIYPNFWGRNMNGENCLTKKEVEFLHDKGIKIVPIYHSDDDKKTEEQGKLLAKKIGVIAMELRIPAGTGIFLEIADKENASTKFMKGFADGVMMEGYTPGFKANTDSKYSFDKEFSREMQTDKDVFRKCLVWAVAPVLAEYEKMTTTHLIHPDNWVPFAPSGISRSEIAVWQYGKDCHPIENNKGAKVVFHLDLVRNEQMIIEKMF